jgi:hypothetical protein
MTTVSQRRSGAAALSNGRRERLAAGRSGRRGSERDAENLIAAVSGFLTAGDPVTELESEHRAEVAADARAARRR